MTPKVLCQKKRWRFFLKIVRRSIKEAIKEKEQRESNPPECPESCELKQEFLETPKDAFNKPQVSTDFILARPTGNVDEYEEFVKTESIILTNRELQIEIESLEEEEIKLREKINSLYLKVLKNSCDDNEFIGRMCKRIQNGYSEKE